MTQTDDEIQKSLAPPGAGLPVVQAFFLRHFFFPVYCRVTSWKKALAVFLAEGDRVVALAELLSPEQLQERILVKAPVGMEDSSRYWSAEMVLEHLIEVGSRIAMGIVELTHGEELTATADVADEKPIGGSLNQERLADAGRSHPQHVSVFSGETFDLQPSVPAIASGNDWAKARAPKAVSDPRGALAGFASEPRGALAGLESPPQASDNRAEWFAPDSPSAWEASPNGGPS